MMRIRIMVHDEHDYEDEDNGFVADKGGDKVVMLNMRV